ncbi:MAG: hypothetical protein LJI21_02730 [Wolbachia endosymbiont of Menacanthus eurysternus]|nr:MAG: hypothetical protein LJI21_02730 [Wolbachia endosymbiont of Menacanthus eurysternus]
MLSNDSKKMRNGGNNVYDKIVRDLNRLVHRGQINKFREVFYELGYHYKQHYLRTTIMKCNAKAMYCILSSIKRDEALSVLYDLFRERNGFAFNTLDVIASQSTFLFRTLFNQLNSQQKEDYKKYLKIKSTVGAKHILERFYSKSNASNAFEAESSSVVRHSNTDSRQLRQRKKPTDEFSALNSFASLLPNSAILEKKDNQQHVVGTFAVNCALMLEECYDNMLLETDLESSSLSFDELIYWVTGEQLSNNLQASILEEFHKLEEVTVEPVVKFQRDNDGVRVKNL